MRLILAALLSLSSVGFAAETLDFKIKGMTCNSCVKSVKKKICQSENIAKCEVEVGHAKITAKEGAKLDAASIEKGITSAGFEVEKNSQQ